MSDIRFQGQTRGDAENAGLEYAGLENTAPTWNEKSREHR